MSLADQDLILYIIDVRRNRILESEMERIREVMVGNVRCPDPNPIRQREVVSRLNQIFRALLTEKARQDALE